MIRRCVTRVLCSCQYYKYFNEFVKKKKKNNIATMYSIVYPSIYFINIVLVWLLFLICFNHGILLISDKFFFSLFLWFYNNNIKRNCWNGFCNDANLCFICGFHLCFDLNWRKHKKKYVFFLPFDKIMYQSNFFC